MCHNYYYLVECKINNIECAFIMWFDIDDVLDFYDAYDDGVTDEQINDYANEMAMSQFDGLNTVGECLETIKKFNSLMYRRNEPYCEPKCVATFDTL